MNWADYTSAQEKADMGAQLLSMVANYYGCEPSERQIARRVYKEHDIGPWIEWSVEKPAFRLGTIVEGSDAEFATRWYDLSDAPEENTEAHCHEWISQEIKWLSEQVARAEGREVEHA